MADRGRYRDDIGDSDDEPLHIHQPYRDDPDSTEDHDNLLPTTSERIAQVGLEDPHDRKHATFSHRLQEAIPPRLIKFWQATKTWVRGPQPPRTYKIEPIFPAFQEAPLRLMDRYLPKRRHRIALLALFYALWLLAFSLIQWKSSFAAEIPGYGAPSRLWCGARFWNDRNDCGINGDQCRPFANTTMAFRCPANCQQTQLYTPHAVGDQEIVYRSLVVGGSSDADSPLDATYRGDSFICGAAVHAGFVSNNEGGCGVVELVGEHDNFLSTTANKISSIGFDSYFPKSFRFKPGTQKQCKDLRWPVMVVSVIATCLLSIFTASPSIFFWSTFIILFLTTGLATDPPNLSNYYDLISTSVARLLPASFCMAIMYRHAIRRSLTDLTAQFEKTLLWLGGAWLGALNNYTFEHIPIQRLTAHDLRAQPGAIPALLIIVTCVFLIALGQAWRFRVEGRMPRYLALYALLVGGLLLLIAVPQMNLRIHHYILGLLLLPGTSFQTRPSLLYQGLLVGLFVNGVARWGFASLLETPGALFRDDNIGSLLPVIAPPVVGALANNITFALGPLPKRPRDGRVYDGISILVNDVERLRSYGDRFERGSWVNGSREWTWDRYKEGLPEYFRFAYMIGGSAADYTKAGKWLANGTWVEMEGGAS